ncbi:MAG: hypothetical protein AAF310_04780, partial [Myxococcota bacterium]
RKSKIVRYTTIEELTKWLLLAIFLAWPATATQGTVQEGQFIDQNGNKVTGFGKKDCPSTSQSSNQTASQNGNQQTAQNNQQTSQNTNRTLKITVPSANDAEKIKHYSIQRTTSSGQDSSALRCSTSDTKQIENIDAFPVSALITTTICSSSSKSYGLLCLYADDNMTLIAQIPFHYDTALPGAPSVTVQEGEREVKLKFNVANKSNKDIDTANICYAPAEDNVFAQQNQTDSANEQQQQQDNANQQSQESQQDQTAASCPQGATKREGQPTQDGFVTVGGLENSVEYEFRLQVKDKSGNLSAWSNTVKGTPTELLTALGEATWKRNPLGTHCSCFGMGAPLWLLWAVYRLCMRRRGKRQHACNSLDRALFGFVVVVAVGFVAANPAQAQPGQVSFGINGSPYKPDIDRKLATPVYSRFFSKSSSKGPWLPMLGVEANIHLFDGYGSIQLGPALSYSWANGHARKENGDRSQIPLQLHMYQIRPQLTYVFDPYVEVVHIAPYVRAGFITMGYIFTFDGGLDRHGQHPVGFVLGWDAAFGLLFLLDGIQPEVSTRAQATGVYRHVYLKTELSYAQIDNFGMGGPLLSPKGIFGAPIPLMATFGLLIQL